MAARPGTPADAGTIDPDTGERTKGAPEVGDVKQPPHNDPHDGDEPFPSPQ